MQNQKGAKRHFRTERSEKQNADKLTRQQTNQHKAAIMMPPTAIKIRHTYLSKQTKNKHTHQYFNSILSEVRTKVNT